MVRRIVTVCGLTVALGLAGCGGGTPPSAGAEAAPAPVSSAESAAPGGMVKEGAGQETGMSGGAAGGGGISKEGESAGAAAHSAKGDQGESGAISKE